MTSTSTDDPASHGQPEAGVVALPGADLQHPARLLDHTADRLALVDGQRQRLLAVDVFAGAAGVDQVMVVSDHMTAEFGEKYGCLVKERRILRRAVFVVDRHDKVTYAAYMPALGVEPDYEEVLDAARAALG